MKYNFNSKNSLIRRALILNRLALGKATNVEIAESIGCKIGALKPFLRQLRIDGEIIAASAPFQRERQRMPDILSLAPGIVVPPMPEGAAFKLTEPNDDERDVKISKSWAPISFPQQNPFSALGL